MGVLQEIASSMTGNIAKAILCVRSPGSKLTGTNAWGTASALRSDILNLTDSALRLGSQYSSVTKSGVLGEDFVALEVQFNPSTIGIFTQGTGETVNYMGGDMGNASVNQMIQSYSECISTFQCQLIFDAVNVSDAFMSTDISGSAGSLVSAGMSTWKKGKTGSSGYSVKTQVDGIMALLTQCVTREVVFIWGKMSFRGELMGVDNTYTMFNKNGDPIRGVVNLSISERARTKEDLEYWSEAFDKVFDNSGTGKVATVINSISNNSILNANLKGL